MDKREYNRIHYWLRTKHGKATKCEFTETCRGNSKKFEWALKKDKEYSFNIDDYYQLCKSCHTIYDRKKSYSVSDETKVKMSKAKKGQIPVNKGINSKIVKVCHSCKKEYKAYKFKNLMFCSLQCRYDNMKGKSTRNKKNKDAK